jgi:chemotaxis protein methyltransferase CheR
MTSDNNLDNLDNEFSLVKRDYDFTNEDFDIIQKKIYALCGIVLRFEKKGMVYARLCKRLKALQLTSFKDYLNYISQNDKEISHLVNALTTNLTKFFREHHHFDHLSDVVLPEFIKENEFNVTPKLRIWSAACSSGEEPYSTALTVYNKLQSQKISPQNIKILATDIDTQMLLKAEAGIYSTSDIHPIPPQFKNYFSKSGNDHHIIDPNVKKLITFKQLNLIEKWPFSGPFDVVFCRNVVIYFDKETQRILFDKIADVLKPNGWLYIGHSESLFRVTDRFELIGQTIYRKVC